MGGWRTYLSLGRSSDTPLHHIHSLIDTCTFVHSNTSTVPPSLSRLYELPFDLSKGPPQCVQCCLHAVYPPKVRYQHHVTPTLWSPNTNNIFTTLVNAKNFRMKVLGISRSLSFSLALSVTNIENTLFICMYEHAGSLSAVARSTVG